MSQSKLQAFHYSDEKPANIDGHFNWSVIQLNTIHMDLEMQVWSVY
jgi:hypothetical protein